MLFGHEDKIQLFKKLAKEEKLSHAYLFHGDAGVGKFTFARAFASFLEFGVFDSAQEPLPHAIQKIIDSKSDMRDNQHQISAHPAFQDGHMRGFLDACIVYPTEETIGIDAIRSVQAFLYQTPFRSPYRLVIIDDAHMLTDEAQSSLLKIVEDPPRHALMIFVSHSPLVFYAPLLSRFAHIYFPRMSREMIIETLAHHFSTQISRARVCAEQSFGSIGRALCLLHQASSVADTGNLARELQERIIDMYLGNRLMRSGAIQSLLDRLSAVRRYNTNEKLQRRALQHLTTYP